MSKESKHVRAFIERHTNEGETVVASAEGYIGEMMGSGDDTQYNGALVVSETRVAFYRKGFVGEVLETMPLNKITSVERKSSFGHRVIRLHTSHDDLEFKTFDKEGEAALVEAIDQGRNAASNPERSKKAEDDPMEKLRKLGEMKDAGILTQEEFDEKKAKILSEM